MSRKLETQPSCSLLCASALSYWKLLSAAKVKLSPQMCESDCFGAIFVFFVAAMAKLQ